MTNTLRLFFLLLLLVSVQACKKKHDLVTFIVKSPPPHNTQQTNMYMSGTFNDWSPDDEAYKMVYKGDGLFELAIEVPVSADSIAYKYTRGDWMTAEMADNGHQSANRVLRKEQKANIVRDTIANWMIELPPHSMTSNVRLLHEKFHIPQLDRQREVWLYLPSDYEESSKRYPVIYMHDGQNLFDNRLAPFGEWGVDESMNWIENRFGRSAIIVGIAHGERNRMDEYSPYKHPKHGGGEGERYLEFIVHTLKPYIDQSYRTMSDREHTVIAGSSMGGLISLSAAVYHPETFGKVFAFSPSLWFSEEIYKEVAALKPSSGLKIYMLVGKEEVSLMTRSVERMRDQLIQQGFGKDHLKVVIDPKGHHNELFWRQHFANAYCWSFGLDPALK